MKKKAHYTLKHLSIRVPWHDHQWDGTVCQDPKANGACLVLTNCAKNKDDEKEQQIAGKKFTELNEEDLPPCMGERVTFMANFPITKNLKHPYVQSSPSTHGHLRPTRVTFPPFSAAAVPYHWMLKENALEKSEQYDLDYDEQREPQLDWESGNSSGGAWVQEQHNQKALLNCFFEHFEEETSLVFFYAKEVPFVEESGRVLVGVGRIKKIIPSELYEGSNNRFGAVYWEHMVLHSIRKDAKDGFLLPYYEALEYQKEHLDFDVSDLAVIVPSDKFFEFSYAAEHVSSDSAIRILLECLKTIEKAEELNIGENHQRSIKWIHQEVAKLEQLRGPYPGMGAALCAFGIDKGHFVAAELISHLQNEDENPWILFEKAINNHTGILSDTIEAAIPDSSKKLYKLLKDREPKRLDFLHLLSRFDLTIEQAKTLFVDEERSKIYIERSEKEYLENPYLIYEDLRHTLMPVALSTIDMGLYLKIDSKHLLPNTLIFNDPLHKYRIRALTIQQLERAALAGHTLLPQSEIIKQIRSLSIKPSCELNRDYYVLAEECFVDNIVTDETIEGEKAYQLSRYTQCKSIISRKIIDRLNGKRLELNVDWKQLLDDYLSVDTTGEIDDSEKKARMEKAAALTEIAQSRFSVLIGPAGTGKTTLLTILASVKEIENRGVLLLAPTGKARVRMEDVAKDIAVTAKTIAQFLSKYKRYDGELQQYRLSGDYCEGLYETVILDETSMLTEEMLASTMDCLKGVKRFILVGDHRQLPPIGAGRPFVDIVNFLKPKNIDSLFPKVGKGYTELTIKRRQGGSQRDDLQLAEWFSGGILDPAADEIISKVLQKKNSKYLRIEHWKNESDFEKVFENVLVDELGLENIHDIATFNKSLGSSDGRYFNPNEAVDKVEDWQILSPVREKVFGVKAVNRKIHKNFRKDKITYAYSKNGRIPAPLGLEEIVYGDKVINISNVRRKDTSVWPAGGLNFIANGEIGVVIGQFAKRYQKKPIYTQVEFTSQKGYRYSFTPYEFKEDGNAPLELAYALTVHKSQGSEFGKVFLILPNPCLLLTTEMLYTALTRQKDKVIILMQGNTFDIKELSSPIKSDTLRRITNLFTKPSIAVFENHYLEKNLIHQASDGTMLRSKSELLIYQRLLDKRLDPIYEKPLQINGVEKLPDFTIENEESGKIYYWEHCGMLYDDEYKKRWEAKKKWYRKNRILPYEEGGGENGTLIVTEDKPLIMHDGNIRGGFSVKDIDAILQKVFEK